MNNKIKVCMVVPDTMVMGGIAAVVNGYRGSTLEQDYDITYVESYCNGSKWDKLFKALKAYPKFYRVLRKNRPDLVHIHSSFGPSFYRKLPFILMAQKFGIPVVNHSHGAEFRKFYTDASEKKRKLIEKTYNRCARLVVLSEDWKKTFSVLYPEEQIRVIPNYSTLHPEALSDLSERKHNVLFLGEVGRRKGGYDIPEVARLVAEQVPDVQFIVAGDLSEADAKVILPLVEEKEVQDKITFPGWVRGADKEKLLKEAAIFFLPSYDEGLPMSILDAQGYGLPVVSTPVGGIPRIVVNDATGYCDTPGDTAAMAEHLIRLLNDTDLRTRMGRAGYDLVEKSYSLEAHLRQLGEVWQEVLGREKAQ